ncbi:MAG TPA: sulfate ABC transporter ATP-binding protein [Acidimicrobiales bacterium]|nr:sulfate ABC transporter ATP-binding protein [Acidimicrobiales bacterium]
MSISLESITKRFGPDTVLDDVSDDVPDGSLTALLGPSGSGKSTLLRVIAGLERPDAGRVVLHGRDVTHLPARDRRIGFCFQDYAPFFQMTVFDNVAYGLKVRRLSRADIARRVDELLGLVRLESLASRYPRQLSGGQRQRMALARALAIEPAVLLLDEPFAALDAQVSTELRGWVSSLQARLGVTTILVTHNQSEAMEMGDRLVILNDGRVEQVGSPADVYDKPATDFVRGFLGPVTSFGGESVRPHDLELCEPGEGADAVVESVVRLGFEVRVTVRDRVGESSWIQLSHDEAERRHPVAGDTVGVRPRP